MFALSIYSLFEGFTLGLEEDLMRSIYLMIALIIHKFSGSISLSIAISKAFPHNFKILFCIITVFAIAAPAGITMGILLGKTPPLIHIVLESLSAGILLYIACSIIIV